MFVLILSALIAVLLGVVWLESSLGCEFSRKLKVKNDFPFNNTVLLEVESWAGSSQGKE